MGVINLDFRVTKLEAASESQAGTLDSVDADLTAIDAELSTVYPDSKTLVLDSSTAESTKKFAITVDDDGLITATEIVAEA